MILRSYRWLLLIALVIIVPLGFYTKFYDGPAGDWVNDSLGGVFYELFWCLVLAMLFYKTSPWRIAWIVFLFTTLLEFLQLSDAYILSWSRSFFIGEVLLGNSFNWDDIPYYFIGSGLGGALLVGLRKLSYRNKKRNSLGSVDKL